jgi:hypothetical protein
VTESLAFGDELDIFGSGILSHPVITFANIKEIPPAQKLRA